MVARAAVRTSSCNAGELDPLLSGRVDIKQYYSGGLKFKNFEPVPQSGFRLMSGTMDAGAVRGRLEEITGWMASGDVIDDVAWQMHCFSGEEKIACVVFEGIAANEAGNVQLEVWKEGVWHELGNAFFIDGFGRNRTVGVPPTTAMAVGMVRLRRQGGANGVVTIDKARLFKEGDIQDRPRYCALKMEQKSNFLFSFGAGFVDIWKGKDWVGLLRLEALTATLLPDLDFYAEGATVGVFHEDLKTLRLRRAGSDGEWVVDDWPYEGMPEVDYGGIYDKVTDIWKVMLRATDNGQWQSFGGMALDLSVNGERAVTVRYKPPTGGISWEDQLVADIKVALEDLPSMREGVVVNQQWIHQFTALELTIEFGGQNSGEEYQLSSLVSNTANISALPSHVQIGKTGGEALLSENRGWPGTCALLQDRLAYARMKGQPAAQLLSEVGEYFRVNIKATADNAARLDRLRSQTAEKILRVKESKYFMGFTNEGVYFASNRVISRNEPLNYINASEIGIRVNTTPVDMEGMLYYVSNNGNQVLSLVYDDVSTVYNARVETLLSSHLVEAVMRNVRQVGDDATDASRLWLLREDGRLICANVIRDQEIMGLSEWVAADGGLIREVVVDGGNDVWLCVERGGRLRHEYMQEGALLQQTVKTKTDLAGKIEGLPFEDGATVWAVTRGGEALAEQGSKEDGDEYVMGPYEVSGGEVVLPVSFEKVAVGRWIAPLYESMPHVLVTGDDRILRRPGRIYECQINILETTSMAVAANGGNLHDVALMTASDKVGAVLPPKSKLVRLSGLMGHKMDTTLVISQMRPGQLQVRDYSCSEKL